MTWSFKNHIRHVITVVLLQAEFLCQVSVLLSILILILLASLRYGFFFATLPRRPASRIRLFAVDVETGVFQVLFNEAAS